MIWLAAVPVVAVLAVVVWLARRTHLAVLYGHEDGAE